MFPLVDLRPLVAPVFHYAVRVDELWLNGGRYRPSDGVVIPIYAVFDSGVTGCLVSKKLFYDSAFQFGTYESHVRVRDENGTRNSIGKYFPFTTFRRLIAHTRLTLSFLSQAPCSTSPRFCCSRSPCLDFWACRYGRRGLSQIRGHTVHRPVRVYSLCPVYTSDAVDE